MRSLLILMVKGYRLFLRHWLGAQCRFEPTCSGYALNALEQHGALGGSWLIAGRLLRCHPWCQGGHDPVPAQAFRPFSQLLGVTRSADIPQPKNLP